MKRTDNESTKRRRTYGAPKVKDSTVFETLAMMCTKTVQNPEGTCDFNEFTS